MSSWMGHRAIAIAVRVSAMARVCLDTLHLSAQSDAIGGDSRFSRELSPIPEGTARPFVFDIDRSVMVTMSDKSTSNATMLSHCQRLAHSVAALTAILRRVRRIHFDHLATGAFSLVRQDRKELTPSGVTDALGEMMILHHPFDIQIFDGSYVKLAHDVECRLMVKIRALAGNLPMFLCEKLNRLAPAIASLACPARYPALSGLQFAFGLAQKLRIFDYLTR